MSEIEKLQEKLQKEVDTICSNAERSGSHKWSIADTWDVDLYSHRNAIIQAVTKRGFSVSCSTSWGVIDYFISSPIELK